MVSLLRSEVVGFFRKPLVCTTLRCSKIPTPSNHGCFSATRMPPLNNHSCFFASSAESATTTSKYSYVPEITPGKGQPFPENSPYFKENRAQTNRLQTFNRIPLTSCNVSPIFSCPVRWFNSPSKSNLLDVKLLGSSLHISNDLISQSRGYRATLSLRQQKPSLENDLRSSTKETKLSSVHSNEYLVESSENVKKCLDDSDMISEITKECANSTIQNLGEESAHHENSTSSGKYLMEKESTNKETCNRSERVLIPNEGVSIPSEELKIPAECNSILRTSTSSKVGSLSREEVSIPNEGSSTPTKAGSTPKEGGSTIGSVDVKMTTEKSTALVPISVGGPSGFIGYVVGRYSWYLNRMGHRLEQGMPRTFRMFRVFSVGLKSFVSDFLLYVKVLGKLSLPAHRLEGLGRRELELFLTMPGDMARVWPLLAVSAVPFGQNLALPLGYLFPRQLLCRHFWDLQQNHEFAGMALRKRLVHARPVFRHMQALVDGIPSPLARVRAQTLCHLLGSGVHPNGDQMAGVRVLFQGEPYGLGKLKHRHLVGLCRLHGLSTLPFKRDRLADHARWLRCHDNRLRQELETLTQGELRHSLLTRGINPLGSDAPAMAAILRQWLGASDVGREHDSLLLHLPILLFYNHPTNMSILHQ